MANKRNFRWIAPSGSPISAKELFECTIRCLHGHESERKLVSRVRDTLGTTHVATFSTGRAAMTVLFQALHSYVEDKRRDTIVVPSYTCYSLVASALKGGFKVLVCDIDSVHLGYNFEELASIDFDRVLAVVSASLYGLPDDLPRLQSLVHSRGAFLVDDAAQCLGAKIDGRYLGTFGEAGLLSLDKGKNITSINGGILTVQNTELFSHIEKIRRNLRKPSFQTSLTEYVKACGYYWFLHPALYALPNLLPFLRLGETAYDENFPLERYSQPMAPIASKQLSRLHRINEERIRIAALYDHSLPFGVEISRIPPLKDSEPVYLRYPIRIRRKSVRMRVLDQCKRLGSSGSYPYSVAKLSDPLGRISIHNGKYESGKLFAQQIVTLPTHSYVRERDVDEIARILNRASESTSGE